MSFSLYHEKSAQNALPVLRMIWRTFSRITRTDFQVLYGARVRPLLEYANQVVHSGRTKDEALIERVQRADTKIVASLNSVDHKTPVAVPDLFTLEYRRLREDLILSCALFERGLADRFFTVDPANTRCGHVSRAQQSHRPSVKTFICSRKTPQQMLCCTDVLIETCGRHTFANTKGKALVIAAFLDEDPKTGRIED
ncbi:hypothetical protein CLF_103195 [Clonorchis sinensis]|uniref:Uncharacterized protein n=1 Tax=Clonorchis sinensis TaxID=79923 RepID=G7Y9B0_CLOSI|nr:hypothetical protein CLF_103195 [Clonorchis sinensis]